MRYSLLGVAHLLWDNPFKCMVYTNGLRKRPTCGLDKSFCKKCLGQTISSMYFCIKEL